MKVQFFLSKEAQKQCFIQTGSKPETEITTDWEPAQFSDQQRALLYEHITRDILDLRHVGVVAESSKNQEQLYVKRRFESSYMDGNSSVQEFLALLGEEDSRKANQEREWYEAEHFKKRKHEGFVDQEIGSRVAEYYQTEFNALLDRTEKAKEAYDAIPLEERKTISIAVVGEYDFERAGLRGWWRAYNDAVSQQQEKAKQARAEQEAITWQQIEDWAKTEGSELLKARLRNELNWKKLAIMERIQSSLKSLLSFHCEYNALEGSEDRALGNPPLKMIKAMERAKKALPEWATISLRRIDQEDYDSDTGAAAFDYYNVVGQIGSTKVDLVFV
jgi:hypothetical protein